MHNCSCVHLEESNRPTTSRAIQLVKCQLLRATPRRHETTFQSCDKSLIRQRLSHGAQPPPGTVQNPVSCLCRSWPAPIPARIAFWRHERDGRASSQQAEDVKQADRSPPPTPLARDPGQRGAAGGIEDGGAHTERVAALKGFDPKYADLPDFILKVTRESLGDAVRAHAYAGTMRGTSRCVRPPRSSSATRA